MRPTLLHKVGYLILEEINEYLMLSIYSKWQKRSFKALSDITVNTEGKRNKSEPSEFAFLHEKEWDNYLIGDFLRQWIYVVFRAVQGWLAHLAKKLICAKIN